MHMIRGHLLIMIYVSTNIILTLGRFFEFFNPPEILVGTYVLFILIHMQECYVFWLTLNNPALKGLRMAPIICDCKNACLYKFVRHFNFLLSILLFLFSFSKMSSNPTYNSFISVLPFFLA